MAETLVVRPASGDKEAALFAGPSSSSALVEKIEAGTILRKVGESGNFYEVAYDSKTPNEPQGGTGMTGTVLAYPTASMYSSIVKDEVIAKINNGTPITILDTSNKAMFKVHCFSTQGWIEGYVEVRHIYRDEEETPTARKTRTTKATSTGTVKASKGLNIRSGPGTNYPRVGGFSNGTKITILESKSGWHRVSNGWCSASYVIVDKTNTVVNVSKSDATPTPTPAETKYNQSGGNDNYISNFKNFSYNPDDGIKNNEYYRQLAEKYSFALGAPPKYNMDIDIQYTDEVTAGGGRVMNKTLLSNPSILSICPGKVKMFPHLFGVKKDAMITAALQAATGLGDSDALKKKIEANEPAAFSSKMYAFHADTSEYAKYLNTLCRASAIMLGIGDDKMPNTSTPLKLFDYPYWSIRKKYNPTAAAAADKDNSIFRNFFSGLVATAKSAIDTAVSDTTYVNFFMNGSETSVSESITNGVGDSPLDSVLGTINQVASDINYFTGSGFNLSGNDAVKAMEAVFGAGDSSAIGGLLNLGDNLLKGGKMVLPKKIENASYGKSISCNLKFMSPYGDKLSIFLKCIVPICHLLAMALPKQLSDNMFTYPFVIRACQIGSFNVDLGIISNLVITRGGNDDTSWTVDNLVTEWDVQLEITPLIDELMITSTSDPGLLIKNEGLLDYMANFCGFDMVACNIDTKVNMMISFFKNKILDIPHAIENKLTDSIYNKINPIFRL